MPYEGYIDPVMNNGPGFCSNAPVSELTERVTRAIKASDVSSTPPVVETTDGVTHENQPIPTEPNGAESLGTTPGSVSPSRPIPKLPQLRPTPRSMSTISHNP